MAAETVIAARFCISRLLSGGQERPWNRQREISGGHYQRSIFHLVLRNAAFTITLLSVAVLAAQPLIAQNSNSNSRTLPPEVVTELLRVQSVIHEHSDIPNYNITIYDMLGATIYRYVLADLSKLISDPEKAEKFEVHYASVHPSLHSSVLQIYTELLTSDYPQELREVSPRDNENANVATKIGASPQANSRTNQNARINRFRELEKELVDEYLRDFFAHEIAATPEQTQQLILTSFAKVLHLIQQSKKLTQAQLTTMLGLIVSEHANDYITHFIGIRPILTALGYWHDTHTKMRIIALRALASMRTAHAYYWIALAAGDLVGDVKSEIANEATRLMLHYVPSPAVINKEDTRDTASPYTFEKFIGLELANRQLNGRAPSELGTTPHKVPMLFKPLNAALESINKLQGSMQKRLAKYHNIADPKDFALTQYLSNEADLKGVEIVNFISAGDGLSNLYADFQADFFTGTSLVNKSRHQGIGSLIQDICSGLFNSHAN